MTTVAIVKKEKKNNCGASKPIHLDESLHQHLVLTKFLLQVLGLFCQYSDQNSVHIAFDIIAKCNLSLSVFSDQKIQR